MRHSLTVTEIRVKMCSSLPVVIQLDLSFSMGSSSAKVISIYYHCRHPLTSTLALPWPSINNSHYGDRSLFTVLPTKQAPSVLAVAQTALS